MGADGRNKHIIVYQLVSDGQEGELSNVCTAYLLYSLKMGLAKQE